MQHAIRWVVMLVILFFAVREVTLHLTLHGDEEQRESREPPRFIMRELARAMTALGDALKRRV